MTHGQWFTLGCFAIQLACLGVCIRAPVVRAAIDMASYHTDPSADPKVQLITLMPTFNNMLFNPKYWLLWRVHHWRAWLIRKAHREWGL